MFTGPSFHSSLSDGPIHRDRYHLKNNTVEKCVLFALFVENTFAENQVKVIKEVRLELRMYEMCLFHGFCWIKVGPVMIAPACLHCGRSQRRRHNRCGYTSHFIHGLMAVAHGKATF